MGKTQILMNKLVYLVFSILYLSKTIMYKFWYDYVKPKFGETRLCYTDTDSFIVHIKADGIYKDITEDVETRFDISHFEIDWPLPKGKKWKSNWTNEKWIRWTNYEITCLIQSKNIQLFKRQHSWR